MSILLGFQLLEFSDDDVVGRILEYCINNCCKDQYKVTILFINSIYGNRGENNDFNF